MGICLRGITKEKDKMPPSDHFSFSSHSLFCPAASSGAWVQQWPRDCGIPAACVEDRWARRGHDWGCGGDSGDQGSHNRGPKSLDPIPGSDPSLQLHWTRTVEQHCPCTHCRIWYTHNELTLKYHQCVYTQTSQTIISSALSVPHTRSFQSSRRMEGQMIEKD